MLAPNAHATPRHSVQRPAAQIVESLSGRSDSSGSQRRPQGYHPDEASGVREIYRGPDYSPLQPEPRITDSTRQALRAEGRQPRERRGAQDQVQQDSQRFSTLSNVLRAKHDTAKAAVSNIRS